MNKFKVGDIVTLNKYKNHVCKIVSIIDESNLIYKIEDLEKENKNKRFDVDKYYMKYNEMTLYKSKKSHLPKWW